MSARGVVGLLLATGCGISPVSGSVQALGSMSDVRTIQMEPFDYNGLGVGKKSEAAYLADNKKGDADSEASWENAKDNTYPGRFLTLMNKHLEGQGVMVASAPSPNTVSVKVLNIEPGFNVGVMRAPAKVHMVITFRREQQELAVYDLTCEGADAFGADFDQSYRVGESFAKCGKLMASQLGKHVYQ